MKKLKIYLNNFNIISIFSILATLILLDIFTTSNFFVNDKHFIFNILNLFNTSLITSFLKLILILHIFFILYSFIKRKFYSINISNKSIIISFFFLLKVNVLIPVTAIIIMFLAKEPATTLDNSILNFLINSIYILGITIQILLLLFIIVFMFFTFKNFSEQIKFKYIEGTSIDKYFDNSLLKKINIYQGKNTIDGFLYKNIMFNIKDNIAVVNNEEFNLNVIVEYLELNNKLFNGLNEEDFKIIRLMNY